MVLENSKFCSKCGQERLLSQFNKQKRICDICKKAKDTFGRANTNRQQKVKEYQRSIRKRNYNFVNDYKKKSGCLDCSETNPLVLDFDHVKKKNANVAQLCANYSTLEKISEEIKNCEIRCSNCHRKITAKRRLHLSATNG